MTGLLNPFISFPPPPPAGGDVTFESHTATVGISDATIAVPAGTQNGDLLLYLWHHNESGQGAPSPTGFTQFFEDDGVTLSSRHIWCGWKIRQAGDPATYTPGRHTIMVRISGTHQTTPIHVQSAYTAGWTSPSVVTTVDKCRAFSIVGARNDWDLDVQAGEDMTEIANLMSSVGGDDSLAAGYYDDLTTPAGATGTRLWDANGNMAVLTVTIRPA